MPTKERSRGGAGVTREAWFLKRCKELEEKLRLDMAKLDSAAKMFQEVAPAVGQFDDGIPNREAPESLPRRLGPNLSKGSHRRAK